MIIQEGDGYLQFQHSSTRSDFFQKGTVWLSRNGDRFTYFNSEYGRVLDFNESEVTSPSHTDADDLEALLLSLSYNNYVSSYTIQSLPSAPTGGRIWVSNEADGAGNAYYDGVYWRREDNNIPVRQFYKKWYVRPSTTPATYGAEDGTSYADAWNGFSNIVWASILAGDELYVAGTHNELLTIGASGSTTVPIIIRGDYDSDAGIIDSQDTRSTGVGCNDNSNVELLSLSIISATTQNILIDGTADIITLRNCYLEGSGNQSAQCENTGLTSYFYNCDFENNTDDGISIHLGAHVKAYNCSFVNNVDGFNNDNTASSEITLVDCYFNGNTNAIRLQNDIECTISRCVFDTNTNDFVVISGSSINPTLNNCFFTGAGDFTVNTNAGTVTVNNSYFEGTGNVLVNATATNTFIMNRCLVYRGNNLSVRMQSGTFTMNYCAFYNDTGANEDALFLAGTGTINNCTFIGSSQTGDGIRSVATLTVNNCIFEALRTAVERAGGTLVCNNCNWNDNNTDRTGTITNNDEVAGDPLITDATTFDFSLGAGSVGIDAGTNTGTNTGIRSASWGTINLTPYVTTATQDTSYDLGAYI